MNRPFVVTLVAVLQFVKAAFFFLAAYFLAYDPLVLQRVGYDVSWAVAIVSADGSAMVGTAVDLLHGSNPRHLDLPPITLSMLLMGFWLVYLGWGLMRLQAWARKSRIAFSILQILVSLWTLRVYLPNTDSDTVLKPLTTAQWQNLFVQVTLNLAVAFYFLLDIDVVDAFRVRDLR